MIELFLKVRDKSKTCSAAAVLLPGHLSFVLVAFLPVCCVQHHIRSDQRQQERHTLRKVRHCFITHQRFTVTAWRQRATLLSLSWCLMKEMCRRTWCCFLLFYLFTYFYCAYVLVVNKHIITTENEIYCSHVWFGFNKSTNLKSWKSNGQCCFMFKVYQLFFKSATVLSGECWII